MSPLQTRKQLLLAQSELNRVQAATAAAAVKEAVQKLAARASSFGAIAATVSGLFAALRTFQTPAVSKDGPKKSWLQRILKGAAVATALFDAVSFRKSDQ